MHLSRETKYVGLVIFTGLVVSWVRQGLLHHWKSFPSWGDFFGSWFLGAVTVGVVSAIAIAAITFTESFFVGPNKDEDSQRVFFYITMTTLVCALFVWFIAYGMQGGPPDQFWDPDTW